MAHNYIQIYDDQVVKMTVNQGTEEERQQLSNSALFSGELAYTTDTNRLFVGTYIEGQGSVINGGSISGNIYKGRYVSLTAAQNSDFEICDNNNPYPYYDEDKNSYNGDFAYIEGSNSLILFDKNITLTGTRKNLKFSGSEEEVKALNNNSASRPVYGDGYVVFNNAEPDYVTLRWKKVANKDEESYHSEMEVYFVPSSVLMQSFDEDQFYIDGDGKINVAGSGGGETEQKPAKKIYQTVSVVKSETEKSQEESYINFALSNLFKVLNEKDAKMVTVANDSGNVVFNYKDIPQSSSGQSYYFNEDFSVSSKNVVSLKLVKTLDKIVSEDTQENTRKVVGSLSISTNGTIKEFEESFETFGERGVESESRSYIVYITTVDDSKTYKFKDVSGGEGEYVEQFSLIYNTLNWYCKDKEGTTEEIKNNQTIQVEVPIDDYSILGRYLENDKNVTTNYFKEPKLLTWGNYNSGKSIHCALQYAVQPFVSAIRKNLILNSGTITNAEKDTLLMTVGANCIAKSASTRTYSSETYLTEDSETLDVYGTEKEATATTIDGVNYYKVLNSGISYSATYYDNKILIEEPDNKDAAYIPSNARSVILEVVSNLKNKCTLSASKTFNTNLSSTKSEIYTRNTTPIFADGTEYKMKQPTLNFGTGSETEKIVSRLGGNGTESVKNSEIIEVPLYNDTSAVLVTKTVNGTTTSYDILSKDISTFCLTIRNLQITSEDEYFLIYVAGYRL